MKLIYLVMICSTIIISQGCKKDTNTSNPPTSSGLINITGVVYGSKGAVQQGAQVSINGSTAFTDVEGVFRLKGVSAQIGLNYLQASLAGYFTSGKSFHYETGSEVNVIITLAQRVLAGSINAGTGGEVTDTSGLKVLINPNSIEGGYQGAVNIYTHFINPTTQQGALEIPGFDAENDNNQIGVLRSFGMSNIELEDNNGAPLKLAKSATAKLTFPVPNSLLSGADPVIAMWYFDESIGIWKEEGNATLVGGNYVGDVTHFSTWNVDNFECGFVQRFQFQCGTESLANSLIKLDYAGSSVNAAVVTTGSSGIIAQSVPCNEKLNISLVAPNGTGATFNLGTIDTKTQKEGLINVPVNCPPYAAVRGQAVDGSGNPVTNGYVYLKICDYKSAPVFFDNQGNFEISAYNFNACTDDAKIVAWDLDNFITVDGPTITINDNLTILSSPLIIAGAAAKPEGRIFVGSRDDKMYCLDSKDGSIIWSFNTSGDVSGSPAAYDNGKIYFGSQIGKFFCLNAIDGSLLWNEVGGNSGTSFKSPSVDNNVVYYSTSKHDMIEAKNSSTGTTIWDFDVKDDLTNHATFSGNLIYSGNASGKLQAINKTTGILEWEYLTGNDIRSSACVADGKVFFASDDGSFYALDALTGTKSWSVSGFTGNLYGSPTVENGIVYFQSNISLNAYSTSTGSLIWSNSYTGFVGSDPVVESGKIYTATPDKYLRCLNASDGTEIWKVLAFTNAAYYAPVIVDGVLYHHKFDSSQHTFVVRDANTGVIIWEKNFTEAMLFAIVVDDQGVAHYPSTSGMRQ